jgi:hypothetical protein
LSKYRLSWQTNGSSASAVTLSPGQGSTVGACKQLAAALAGLPQVHGVELVEILIDPSDPPGEAAPQSLAALIEGRVL